MTVSDAQLASLVQLRAQIEGIDRAALDPSVPLPLHMDVAVSYSFGIFDGPEKIVADIVADVRTILATLRPLATLETNQDGFAARTIINYAGASTSVWTNYVSANLTQTHFAAIQKAYAVRAAFAAAIAAAGSTMVSISIAVANPLTALHALASAKALRQALENLANAAAAAA